MKSILGALVGDAAGATLEFYRQSITEEKALHAMKMPGGGHLRVGSGQITDDGELTLTLLRSLRSSNSSSLSSYLHSIAKGYSDWYESCPFDIGMTCGFAFETYYDFFRNKINTLDECFEIIRQLNSSSEANGSLMRATAIASYIDTHPDLDIQFGIQLAKEDAKLSHPNIVCQEVNMIYVFSLIHLLKGYSPNDTLTLTDHFIVRKITSNKVKEWYFNESHDITSMECTKNIGHVRWGFVLAYYFLRNPQISFEEAIKKTLMKGGDTDTNAAIVGGMVACYQDIPQYMSQPVLLFDCTKDSLTHRIRPYEYSAKRLFINTS